MPQLDISSYFSQIFWLIVCFSMLYVSSSLIILPRLKKILADRKRLIDGDLRQSVKLEDRIAELQAESEALRSSAAKEYQHAVKKANEKSLEAREHSIELYRIESEKLSKESRQRMLDFVRDIESEKQELIHEIAQIIKKKIIN